MIYVSLAGAGGNGAQMISCLARMSRALPALGLPRLHVTLYDHDMVSQSNVGRQLFLPQDVGQNKAVLLIHRANTMFGLSWAAVPKLYSPEARPQGPRDDILITCVDSGAARAGIQKAYDSHRYPPTYWLDIGSDARFGQVWLGQFQVGDPYMLTRSQIKSRLLTVVEAFPSQYDGSEPESDTPTCSLAEALEKQDLFINDVCVDFGADLLWNLLRRGQIQYQGYWINLKDGTVRPEPIYEEAS